MVELLDVNIDKIKLIKLIESHSDDGWLDG